MVAISDGVAAASKVLVVTSNVVEAVHFLHSDVSSSKFLVASLICSSITLSKISSASPLIIESSTSSSGSPMRKMGFSFETKLFSDKLIKRRLLSLILIFF